VANRLGQPINRQGFTIIPYLDPFTDNWLDLDPQGLNDHVEIVSSSTTVVPDSGAAVKVKFVTRTGYPWFAHVTLPDGAAPRWARRCLTTAVGRLAPSVRAGCCMPGAAGRRQRLGSMGRTQRATLPVGLCHPRRRGATG
jgi:outer membrane usher protein